MDWEQIMQIAIAAISVILQEIQAAGGTATPDQSARLAMWTSIKEGADTLMGYHVGNAMVIKEPKVVSHQ